MMKTKKPACRVCRIALNGKIVCKKCEVVWMKKEKK